MPMSPRHLLSATLAALALAGCSPTSSDGGSDATASNTDANQVGSIFDHQPQDLERTAWKMPTAGLFFYDDTGSTAYAWSAAAQAQARPGASAEDLVVDYTATTAGQSDVSFLPTAIDNGDGDGNFGVVEADDAAASWSGIFARARDNAIFRRVGAGWEQHLPASTAVGTSWQSDRGLVAGAQIFAYRTDGTVAHTPRIRIDGSMNAVDANGNATSDTTKAVIDYTTGTAYVGAWVGVRRIAYHDIVAVNVTAPNGVTGCIRVATTHAYRAETRGGDYDQNVGLDQFSGSATWYWKPGRGIVHESVTETVPQHGFVRDSARNSEAGNSSLADYNQQYDLATFGTPADYTGKPYYVGYQLGFTDGYQDISTVGNPTNRQADMLGALQATDATYDADADSWDDGYHQAFYAAFQAGYNAGFSAGGADWDADYNAVANGVDTQKAGFNGPDATLAFKSLPAAYRYDGMQTVTSLPGQVTILDGLTATGGTYANGYAGLGETRTIYDSAIIADLSKLKPAKDASNQDKVRMIKLPAMGRNVTTTTVRTQTAQPVPDGNG